MARVQLTETGDRTSTLRRAIVLNSSLASFAVSVSEAISYESPPLRQRRGSPAPNPHRLSFCEISAF
jgi:hypothetical protein